MVITRRKPKNKREFKIYLNNKKLQEDAIKYIGIIIDRRFNFSEHTEYIKGKCINLIHTLSKSAKINWGVRHDILRIYTGTILPISSYGAPVWIQCLERNNHATQLKRVQRLINIKIAQAFHTTSYEALNVLTGITPILIELGNLAKYYRINRGNEHEGLYGAPTDYRNGLILQKQLR
jgi:hypothetical protein